MRIAINKNKIKIYKKTRKLFFTRVFHDSCWQQITAHCTGLVADANHRARNKIANLNLNL